MKEIATVVQSTLGKHWKEFPELGIHVANSPFHSSWKVTKLLDNCARTLREVEMVIIRKKLISMSIISTSLTVRA